MSTFASRLKEARKEAKLTQNELGEKVGVQQSTIAALETGEHKTARNSALIAAAVRVEALWLETGKGPKRSEGVSTLIDMGIPSHVLALAQQLALIPDEKLKAIAVLLGLKLS